MRIVTSCLVWLALVFSIFVAWGMPFPNEDLFLAFCAGRDTLAGHLAGADTWSFTIPGKVWIDQSWLSHLAYYLSYIGLGDLGPVLLKGVLLVGCLFLLYLRCRALSVGPLLSVLALTLGTLALAPFLKIRAENFGMCLFVLMTGILSLKISRTRLQQASALLVLGLWSNCHGSFMLGFFLIGLKLALEALRSLGLYRSGGGAQAVVPAACGQSRWTGHQSGVERSEGVPERVPQADPWGWLVTWILALGVIAFANPYGPENIAVPFTQLGTRTVTEEWVDWRPLLHWYSLSRGVFKPVSVWPFLVEVVVTCLLCVASMLTRERRTAVSFMSSQQAKSDFLMEALVPLLLLPLVFRFQRIVIFAAPAMVPLLAALMQSFLDSVRDPRKSGKGLARFSTVASAGLACIWLMLLVTIFCKAIVVRYLPGNPLAFVGAENSVLSRLMSYNLRRSAAVEFLAENHIGGRFFTNEFLSNYLLFNLPELRPFFDLRAQSVFPDEIIRQYLSVISPPTGGMPEAVKILSDSQVSTVVLDTSISTYADLAIRLMGTGKWGCIYSDPTVMVLAAVDSKRFGPMLTKGDLGGFRYRSPQTKLVSEGFLALFTKGSVDSLLLQRLKEVVQQRPDPQVYGLLIKAMNGRSRCLTPETRSFLESEAKRLSSSDYMVRGGAFTVLRSLLQILALLERDEFLCGAGVNFNKFSKPLYEYSRALDNIKRHYGGL